MSGERIGYMCATVILGVVVVVSYGVAFWYYRRADAVHWRGLTGRVWWAWAASAGLTALSFIFTFVYWWCLVDPDKTVVWGVAVGQQWSTVGGVFIGFLVGAIAWAWTFWKSENEPDSCWPAVNNTGALWVTAAGAVGLFVLAVGTRDQDDVGWKQPLACICGAVLAGHHLYMDAVFWGMTGGTYVPVS